MIGSWRRAWKRREKRGDSVTGYSSKRWVVSQIIGDLKENRDKQARILGTLEGLIERAKSAEDLASLKRTLEETRDIYAGLNMAVEKFEKEFPGITESDYRGGWRGHGEWWGMYE